MQGPAESKPSNQKVFFYLKAEFSTISKDIYKYIYVYIYKYIYVFRHGEKTYWGSTNYQFRVEHSANEFLQRFNSNLYAMHG